MDNLNKSEVPHSSSDKNAILLQPKGTEDAPLPVASDLKSETEETGDSCDKGSDGPSSTKKRNKMIGFLNINGLYNKLDQLQYILSNESSDFNIFALNETKLNESHQDNELNIPGYKLIRKDRPPYNSSLDRQGNGGGGVAVYVDHNTPYVRHPEFESDKIETVWIEIIFPFRNVLICTLYRPPDSKVKWMGNFDEMMSKPYHDFEDIIIIGDFNIDFPKKCKKRWKKSIASYNLKQMVTEKTRETATSRTLIDHVYTTNVERIQDVTVLQIRLSDHYPVRFLLQFVDRENKSGCHKSIMYRPIDSIHMNQFRNDLDDRLRDYVFSEEDTDRALEMWQDIFEKVLNEHAPLKIKEQQKYQLTWIDNVIKGAIGMRDNTPPKKSVLYHAWRDKVNSLVQISKTKFFKGEIHTAEGDSEAIRQLVFRKLPLSATTQQNLSDPVCLLSNDKKVYNTPDIANLLNKFFTSKAAQYANDDWSNDDNSLLKLKQFVSPLLTRGFFKIPKVSNKTVSKSLKDLNGSEITGWDEIPAKLLKESWPQLTGCIRHIINTSIESSAFPSSWKKAKVIPILENDLSLDVSNYRSISSLPVLSKILETHVHSKLYNFFVDCELLLFMPYTCKFHEKHLPEAALLKVVDRWMGDIDKGHLVGCVFLNLEQAYDLVNHEILLRKLEIYGLSEDSVKWFTSYLGGRQQCTFVNGTLSDPVPVPRGLPKESILGFLLFIIFINDMALNLQHCSVELFENDLIFYVSNTNIGDIKENLENDMACVGKWCKSNQMVINADKMESMLICSRQKRTYLHHSKQSLEVNVDGARLEKIISKKLFRVHVDHNLEWSSHMDDLCKRVSINLNELQRNRPFIDREASMLYYNDYVLPILCDFSVVWGTCYEKYLKKLTALQENVAYTINSATSKQRTPSDLFKFLKLQPLDKLIRTKRLTMVYESLNGRAPQCLIDMFQYTDQIHEHELRSTTSRKLHLNVARSEFGIKRFSYRGAKEWNELPPECRDATSLHIFKQQLNKVE